MSSSRVKEAEFFCYVTVKIGKVPKLLGRHSHLKQGFWLQLLLVIGTRRNIKSGIFFFITPIVREPEN